MKRFLVYSLISFFILSTAEMVLAHPGHQDSTEVATESEEVSFWDYIDGQVSFELQTGLRNYTGAKASHIDSNLAFGAALSFFIFNDTAIQGSYFRSGSDLSIETPMTNTISGTISQNTYGFHLKHFFYFEEFINKNLDLNLFLIGGLSSNYQTFKLQGSRLTAVQEATSVDVGAGIQIPFKDERAFISLTSIYRNIDFPSDSQQWQDDVGSDTGVSLQGDEFITTLSFGVNI